MISLDVLFWIFVILFAVIGSIRGWAKEVLVTFAMILAIFIIKVMEAFVPFVRDNMAAFPGETLFWMRVTILGALVFFSFQSPNLPLLADSNRFTRDRFQDILLGFFLGALNGYLIWGSIWFFLHQSNYPFWIISQPIPGSEISVLTENMMDYMPPSWLGTPMIYFAVAIAFVFVLVVFI